MVNIVSWHIFSIVFKYLYWLIKLNYNLSKTLQNITRKTKTVLILLNYFYLAPMRVRMRRGTQRLSSTLWLLERLGWGILLRTLLESDMADSGKDYITNSSDPKNIQDLTQFVSKTMLSSQIFYHYNLLICKFRLEVEIF